ncbi:MAG: hypothetical protein GY913_22255 [Proteobacteria bacterium]|nr:hypothetical protein [Pseudomonadota bacterium]MCP4919634.1 hypothetical protein [Pseudomonadota bacterium]
MGLGEAERGLGKLDKARKRFNKALKLEPEDLRALQGLGRVLYDQEDWDALLHVHNKVIYHAKKRAELVSTCLAKGFVLDAHLGLAEKAALHYQKALAFQPDHPLALLRRAELALRERMTREAVSLAELAVEQELDADLRARFLLVLASAAGLSGDMRRAPELLAAAHRADSRLELSMGKLDVSDPDGIAAALKMDLQRKPPDF